MRRRLPISSLLFLFTFFLIFSISVESRAADSPSAVVTAFHEQLLSIMKDAQKLSVKLRYEQLNPNIDRLFDMPRMTRIASGESWTNATPEQRQRLTKAFKHMGVSRLVTLFDGYSGEIFETLSERPGPQNSRAVQTQLRIPGEKPVGITYITVRAGNRWAIVDALLDNNISELTVRRSEYRSVLKEEGVEGLIKVLNKKAKELLAE